MPFELSWRPGGSVGFLIDLFRFFELTMVVVRGREVFFEADGLYCRQLMLLDPAHQIPRPFVSRCYLSNPVVKKHRLARLVAEQKKNQSKRSPVLL